MNNNQTIAASVSQQLLHKWWILTAMCLIIVIISTDITALNIALPTIGHQFHSSLSQLQWIINIYIVVGAMFSINGGKLGDSFGHRKLFIIGATIFGIASLLCGTSPNETFLIAARALQGIGAALAFPATNVIIFAAFEEKQKAFAISIISATSGTTQSIAPTIGGFIVKYLGWHWIFFINLPIIVLAITLAMMFCPKNILPPHHQKFDSLGTMLLSIGLLLLMFAFNEAQNWGLASQKFLLSTLAGLILLTTFVLIELRSSNPLINVRLLKNKIFALVNTLRFLISFTWMITMFVLGLALQNILRFDPVFSGIIMLFMTGTFAISSPIIGKLVDIYGGRTPIIISLLLFTCSFAVLSYVNPEHPLPTVIAGVILLGLGFATSAPPCNTIAMASVDAKYAGMANSIYLTANYIGCAVGATLAGIVISSSSLSTLKQQLIVHNIITSPKQLGILKQIVDGSFSVNLLPQNFSATVAAKLLPLTQQIYLHSFSLVMMMCIGLCVFGLILTLLTKKDSSCKKY